MSLKARNIFLLLLIYHKWPTSMGGQSELQSIHQSLEFSNNIKTRLTSGPPVIMTKYTMFLTVKNSLTINASFPNVSDVIDTINNSSHLVYSTIKTSPSVSPIINLPSIKLQGAEALLQSMSNATQEHTPFLTSTNFKLPKSDAPWSLSILVSTPEPFRHSSVVMTYKEKEEPINSSVPFHTHVKSLKGLMDNKTYISSQNVSYHPSHTQSIDSNVQSPRYSVSPTHSTSMTSTQIMSGSPMVSKSDHLSTPFSTGILSSTVHRSSFLHLSNDHQMSMASTSLKPISMTSQSNTLVSLIPHQVKAATYAPTLRYSSKHENHLFTSLSHSGQLPSKTSIMASFGEKQLGIVSSFKRVSRRRLMTKGYLGISPRSKIYATETVNESSVFQATESPTKKTKVKKTDGKSGFPAWIAILSSAGALTAIITIIAVTFKFVRWNKDHGDYSLWVSNLELQPITSRNAEVLT